MSSNTLPAFTLDKDNIETVAERLGRLYQDVSIANDPMFGWVQIINDVTILGEELRRNRAKQAAERVVKVLFRLLQFIGYYQYIQKNDTVDFAGLLAKELRRESYKEKGPPDLKEGLSKWILVKYPCVCSKCGETPCVCLVRPWIFENRREDPDPYEPFRAKAETARQALRSRNVAPLTLHSMLDTFEHIYRNQYYHQDPWKLGMHLSEELGEATIELSRLELAYRGRGTGYVVTAARELAVEYGQKKLKREIDRMSGIATPETIEQRERHLNNEFEKEKKAFTEGDIWEVFCERVSEKFKEEVSDVFSWIAAVLLKLEPGRRAMELQRGEYVEKRGGGNEYMKCPWCSKSPCSNDCLVTHSILSEIMEKITKF